MQDEVLNVLRQRRGTIRERWAALLRVEPVTTPLANPDTLVYLLDPTLDEIFQRLETAPDVSLEDVSSAELAAQPECECGRNPFIAYFLAGTQAMLEALILAQAEVQALDPVGRDAAVAKFYAVMRALSRREVENLCSVCQYRRVHHLTTRLHAP